MKLEIAVIGAEGARIAAEGGADRIELCTVLERGGITPSAGLMEAALEEVGTRTEVHPLVRCRPGDFLYSADDVRTMEREARLLASQGAHGLVIGALAPSGFLDVKSVQAIADAGRSVNPNIELTFHRAIDQSPDALAAVETLIDLGFTRVLSSGHAAKAGDGVGTHERMVRRAAGRLQIMAGGGLEVADIPLMHRAGVDAVHLSAKRISSTLRNSALSLGTADGEDPTAYMLTDPKVVRAARAAVDAAGSVR
ncbi:copper homeostasis protein CutC [Pseudarthrobacter sp. J1738]|uniref:copper homeostasis protein CutC n=1 Tax=unclassified Pseudarthrobacter TaxID=2647000 RepID=UPI003D295EB2